MTRKMKPRATKIHVALFNRFRILETMFGFSSGIPEGLATIVSEQFLGIRNVSKAFIFIKKQGWLTYDETRGLYQTSSATPTWSSVGEDPLDLSITELRVLVTNFRSRLP
jgi:hypothetical protein